MASNGVQLPFHIRKGELLTDSSKKTWRLGRSIGLGGCGEVYLASDEINKPVSEKTPYVIKVEQHNKGPLFVEKNFYIQTAQVDMVKEWRTQHNKPTLGVPHYLGTGSHHYDGKHYRFLVLPRFGLEIDKVFIREGKKFNIKMAFTLALYIMDILEYIHCHGYVHCDIKGANLMLGLAGQAPVYLLDYGLATRYVCRDGQHKKYRSDKRCMHMGTLKYTSRDAHVGVFARRGDLESLGYNLVHWLCGRLPWEGSSDYIEVEGAKRAAMDNITSFLKHCFKPNQPPAALDNYLQYVANLEFESKPDYEYCKRLFHQAIIEEGFQDDGKLSFHPHAKKIARKRKLLHEPENKGVSVCHKKKCVYPCDVITLYRRTTKKSQSAAAAHTTKQDSPTRSERSGTDSYRVNQTPSKLSVIFHNKNWTHKDTSSSVSSKLST